MSFDIAIPFDAFDIRARAKALGARWKSATKTWAMPDKASMDKVATMLAVGVGQDAADPDADLTRLRAELATARAELDKMTRLFQVSQEQAREALKRAVAAQLPSTGHDLTEAHVKAVAEAAGRATVDAVIKALGALRVKPNPTQEAERIARMTPLPDGAPTPKARILDTDDAPVAAPVTAAQAIRPDALAAMRARLKGSVAR